MKETTRLESVILTLTIFSVGIILIGPTSLGVELERDGTQTPSEQVGRGAVGVIEDELTSINVQSESELLSETRNLIDKGVPPGTMVSVVKSIKSGHLEAEKLKNAYEEIETKVLEEGKPPGLVIKSIKTGSFSVESEVDQGYNSSSKESGEPEGNDGADSSATPSKAKKFERGSTEKGASGENGEGSPGKTKEKDKHPGHSLKDRPDKEVKSKKSDNGKGKSEKSLKGSDKAEGKGKEKDELKDKIKESDSKGPPDHAKGKGGDKDDKNKGNKGKNKGKG